MATVYVTMAYVNSRPEVFSGTGRTETITSSGTAASGSLQPGPGEVAQIFCDSAVIVNVNGTATATAGIYCPAGQQTFIRVPSGKTVSVIDA